MISLYNGASTSRDQNTLLEKKKLQWAREKAEGSDEWFPFGRPGGGAPHRSSIRRSTSGQRSSSQSRPSGLNQSPPLISPGNSPTNGQPAALSLHQGQGYQQHQTQGHMGPQNGNQMPNGNTSGHYAQQQYGTSQGPYQQSQQIPYQHNIVVNGDSYPQLPYALIQGANGVIYQQPVAPVQPQGYKHLAAIPASSTAENYAIPQYQAMSSSNGLIPNSEMQQIAQPPTGLSYTEQWANQLPYWEPGVPSDVMSPPSANVPSLPQLKATQLLPDQFPTQSAYGGSVSTIAQDPEKATRSMGNLAQPQTAWVAPQPQRTAVVQPQPSMLPPTSLALDQSLNSSFGNLNGLSPMGQNNGFLDTSLGASQHVYTPLQQSFDAMSSGTGNSAGRSSRRRRITGPTEEEEWEKADRNLEQKMILDEQVAEKQREKLFKAERERKEQERAAAEMRRIEMRETMENEAERSKWKDLWDTEQKREKLVLQALEKAKEEARLLKEAKLMHHVGKSMNSPLSNRSFSNGHGYEHEQGHVNGHHHGHVNNQGDDSFNNYDHKHHDENLNQVSRSIDALERARDEAEEMLRKEKLKKELERRDRARHQEEQRRAQEQQQDSGYSGSSRSKSVPPPKASLSSLYEDRPIKPAQVDPLELWNQIKEQSVENQDETPRRRAPVRQSMRTKSKSSDVAKMRKNRRADSLERLAKKSEESSENSEPQPPERPPRSKKDKEIKGDANSAQRSEETITDGGNRKKEKKIKDRHERSPSPKTKPPSGKNSSDITKSSRPILKSKTKKSQPAPEPEPDYDQSENNDKALTNKKLLNRRPSIEQMLYPPGEKPAITSTSSDSDGTNKTDLVQKKMRKKEDNPWGDSLGGLNPLLQPLSTRTKPRRSKDKSQRASSKSPVRPQNDSLVPSEDQKASSTRKTSNYEVTSPLSSESPVSIDNSGSSPYSASHLRGKSVDSRNRIKPVFSGSGQAPASVRVNRFGTDESDQSWRPFVRGGLRASTSMENFNAKSPLYSSISAKRGQPTERQQKILDQLASLRLQLKSKQKEVENSFVIQCKSPTTGRSRMELFENNPSSDC